MKRLERSTFARLSVSILLAILAVGLFILNQTAEVNAPEGFSQNIILSIQNIDKEVDRIFERFGIEKTRVQRREYSDAQKRFTRVEKRVVIPPQIVPMIVNREFNALARRYQGRAVATENLRENTVTIHIVLDGFVVQTIILKPKPELKETGKKATITFLNLLSESDRTHAKDYTELRY